MQKEMHQIREVKVPKAKMGDCNYSKLFLRQWCYSTRIKK